MGFLFGLAVFLSAGAAKGVVTAVVITLLTGFIKPPDSSEEPAGPVHTWRRERVLWLTTWPALGVVLATTFGSPFGFPIVLAMFISLV